MPVFNYPGKEVNIKIVYYGPGLSGKTTNIQYIHENIRPDVKGKLVSLATQTDRTLFFDFLPMELGSLGGYKIRLHLYTVPGQVHYNATRKLVLKGVDGVVLVADSQKAMKEANLESLANLEKNLQSYGKDLETLPHIIQGNKRDLDNLLSIENLNSQLNHYGAPFMEAVASSGDGVLESLREILKLVMRSLKDQFPLGESADEEQMTEPAKEDLPQEETPEKEDAPAEAEVPEEIPPGEEPSEEPSIVPVLPEEAEMLEPVQIEETEDIPLESQYVDETRTILDGENRVVVSVPVSGVGEVELTVQISARMADPSPVASPEQNEPDEPADPEVLDQIQGETDEDLPPIDDAPPMEELMTDLDEEVQLGSLDEPLGEPIPDPYAETSMEPLPQELAIPDSAEQDAAIEDISSLDEPAEETSGKDEGETIYDPSFEELEFSAENGEIPGLVDEKKKGKKKGLLGMFKKKG